MSDPVREEVIQDVVATLGTMSETTGYAYTYHGFERWWLSGDDYELPHVIVLDAHEDVTQENYDLHARTISIEVRAEHEVMYTATENPSRVGNLMIADIERALMDDVTRGGLAVDTRLISSEKDAADPMEPTVGVSVQIEVDYRTKLTDPSTKV